MKCLDPQIRELLAAEYVLGTLRGPACRRLERWLREDPGLRAVVTAWEQRLNPLVTEAWEVAPPPELGEKIQERIAGDRRQTHWSRWWQSLPLWRGIAGVALALLLLALLFLVPGQGEQVGRTLAVVDDRQARPTWVISRSSTEAHLRIETLRSVDVDEGKTCVLWLQGHGGRIYRVGPLPEERGIASRPLPEGVAGSLAKSRVVVSIEKGDRVPHPTPTGQILYRDGWFETS